MQRKIFCPVNTTNWNQSSASYALCDVDPLCAPFLNFYWPNRFRFWPCFGRFSGLWIQGLAFAVKRFSPFSGWFLQNKGFFFLDGITSTKQWKCY
jgi:hypothetical protein